MIFPIIPTEAKRGVDILDELQSDIGIKYEPLFAYDRVDNGRNAEHGAFLCFDVVNGRFRINY